jgi:hypothetical protein
MADASGEVDTRVLHRLEGLEEAVGTEDIYAAYALGRPDHEQGEGEPGRETRRA